MYLEFFRLKKYPFQNTSDSAFFYEGTKQREALARLTYGIQESKGLMLITGKVGSGKTMLVRGFTSRLGPEWQVIEVNNPWLSAQELFRFLMLKLNIETDPHKAGDPPLDLLRKSLIDLEQRGGRVLLIIDEAQLFSHDALEGVRLLYNLETESHKLLPTLLVGQEELDALLRTHPMRALHQRIRVSYVMDYLSTDATDAYIQHRLRMAGGDAYLFPSNCITMIHGASRGCPRMVNNICDDTLLHAFGLRQTRITQDIVEEVIASLKDDETDELGDEIDQPPAKPVDTTKNMSHASHDSI